MAVQSMRSATYVHPGEQLTCQGCHERKHAPPSRLDELPLALQRAPSKIAPDVDGSNPFNYVRLVQPVLDRHCVECHQEKKALDLSGDDRGRLRLDPLVQNLAGKYGFYFHVGERLDQHGRPRRQPHDRRASSAPERRSCWSTSTSDTTA